jgi:ABC-2 type transport system permease protein
MSERSDELAATRARVRPSGGAPSRPLLELTRVRVLEFVREPEAVFWVFVFPVLLALALGIAFRKEPVRQFRVAVVGEASAAHRVEQHLAGAHDLAASVLSAPEAAQALRKGKVDVIVEVGAAASGGEAVTYRFDAARADGRAARFAVNDALQRAFGRRDAIAAHGEPVAEPGSRYIDFLIPGLVGLNLMGSGMWGLGFAIVQARTRKLLKRFAATPMRRSHYLLSFVFSRLIFLVLEVAAIVGFGWLVFGVRVRGTLADLAVVSLVGAACFGGIGLLVAARPRTVEAVSGWMNLVMLPMWLLSGTFFSYERFPDVVQPAIRALPLTALNDGLRAVMNDGAPLFTTAPQLLVMGLWGVVSFAVCLRIFRWQ